MNNIRFSLLSDNVLTVTKFLLTLQKKDAMIRIGEIYRTDTGERGGKSGEETKNWRGQYGRDFCI